MPITQSAKKALRQNRRRNAKNVTAKAALKKVTKEYQRLLAQDVKKAAAYLPTLFQRIDKSVRAKIIKKNKADRMKSRLSKRVAAKK